MEQTTPKQLEILLLLYRFRFLNRTHIQKFLNHKDPRRINTWLKDLVDKNILGRHYSTKLKENTYPAIYFLAIKSKRILEDLQNVDEKLLKRVYREKTLSQRFINHHLLLADIFFYLKDSAQINNSKLHFYTKTDLSKHYYLLYNRPDAYIAIKSEDQTKRYFLEIIDEGTPRFMLRKRIEQYIEYYDCNKWQDETSHLFPSVLLVCPNETTKNFLHKHINQVLEEEVEVEIDFFLATKEDIKSSMLKSNVWEKVVEE